VNEAWQFLKELTNPESIVKLGLPLLLFVIFAETGLFFGFFLPGDNLLIISGFLCATKPEIIKVNIFVLIILMSVCAIAGNFVGYLFGKRVGESLYKRPDSFFFKKRHIESTRSFYNKYGGMALFLGRFLPIVRTFAPILAGVIKIDFKKFMLYNITGAFCWTGSICGVSYYLGLQFPWLMNYMSYIVVGMIVITTIPVMITYLKERKK
jgi:membrane-associated protein